MIELKFGFVEGENAEIANMFASGVKYDTTKHFAAFDSVL